MKNIQFGVEGANKPDVYLMYIGGDSQTSDINLYNVEIVTSFCKSIVALILNKLLRGISV